MNKLNVSILVLSFLSLGLCAQAQENRFETGLEFGPNASRLWGNELVDSYYGNRIGFSSGVFFQMNMKRRFSLRSNLSYEQKGGTYRTQLRDLYGNDRGSYTYKNSFHYTTLGVLGRFTWGKKVNYFVNVGPYFAVLLSEIEHSSGEQVNTYKYTNTKDFSPIDLGVSGGLGLSIPVRSKYFVSLEARGNVGLYDVSARRYTYARTLHHSSYNLLFGLGYRL